MSAVLHDKSTLTGYKSYEAAVRALHAMRVEGELEGVIAKIVESPYGGFVIRTMPVDIYVDFLSEGHRPFK